MLGGLKSDADPHQTVPIPHCLRAPSNTLCQCVRAGLLVADGVCPGFQMAPSERKVRRAATPSPTHPCGRTNGPLRRARQPTLVNRNVLMPGGGRSAGRGGGLRVHPVYRYEWDTPRRRGWLLRSRRRCWRSALTFAQIARLVISGQSDT